MHQRWDWEHYQTVVERSIDDILEKTKDITSLNNLDTNKKLVMMEAMQNLCAVRVGSPEIWSKLDKTRVKNFVERAQYLKLGTQQFNENSQLASQ